MLNITTHTHNSPLQVSEEIQKDITILENIDLNNLEDAIKLTNGADLVIHCAESCTSYGSVRTDIQGSLGNITLLGNVLESCVTNEVDSFFDLNSSTG